MNSSSDSEIDMTLDMIKEEAKADAEILLPLVSKRRYMKSYKDFFKWRAENKVKSFSESVFLTYFSELSKKLQPSSLWGIYSMLKRTFIAKHNINLKNYTKLTTFLRKQSVGFKCKKSKAFTAQEVETFLNMAPDDIYLAVKVVLVFGISGACRCSELINITVDNVEKHGQLILVKMPTTETRIERTFVVREEYAQLVQKYQDLRPNNLQTDRFFINYHQGKCLKQVIGRNRIATMAKQIATYLNLPNPNLYFGQCFRRTSVMLLAGSGADLTMLRRHGGLNSSKVTEVYIEESVEDKPKISKYTQYSPQPETSEDSDQYGELSEEEDIKPLFPSTEKKIPSLTFTNVDEAHIKQAISNINIPGKNISLSFTNCSNFCINFK